MAAFFKSKNPTPSGDSLASEVFSSVGKLIALGALCAAVFCLFFVGLAHLSAFTSMAGTAVVGGEALEHLNSIETQGERNKAAARAAYAAPPAPHRIASAPVRRK